MNEPDAAGTTVVDISCSWRCGGEYQLRACMTQYLWCFLKHCCSPAVLVQTGGTPHGLHLSGQPQIPETHVSPTAWGDKSQWNSRGSTSPCLNCVPRAEQDSSLPSFPTSVLTCSVADECGIEGTTATALQRAKAGAPGFVSRASMYGCLPTRRHSVCDASLWLNSTNPRSCCPIGSRCTWASRRRGM